MTVTLKHKDDLGIVEAMLFDGTQESAVGISVWAGSQGRTVNMRYRGGDNADYVLTLPDNSGTAAAGAWVVQGPRGFYFVDGAELAEDYEEVPRG